MILTIDVGNSNTVLVGYKEHRIVYTARFDTLKSESSKLWYVEQFEKVEGSVSSVVVGSVVPSINDVLTDVLVRVFGLKPKFVSQETVPTFKSLLDNPLQIGADFIAASVGSFSKFPEASIIVDIGSATKVIAHDKDGVFQGGAIIPGLGISLKSMLRELSHLPDVSFEFPPSVIGKNTVNAIQSGVMNGCIFTIQGFVSSFKEALGYDCRVILTGGYSSVFASNLNHYTRLETLVNDGLYILEIEGKIRNDI